MVAVDLGDEVGEDGVDVADDFFRAASRAEFAAQDGRQKGEAGDVGEKNGSGGAIGQGAALGECVPAVIGQECG